MRHRKNGCNVQRNRVRRFRTLFGVPGPGGELPVIDGRDANAYTNVAWCFGLHDRAFVEREVYGKVRYMNANGLKRKFDMDAYIRQVDALIGR